MYIQNQIEERIIELIDNINYLKSLKVHHTVIRIVQDTLGFNILILKTITTPSYFEKFIKDKKL